MTLIGTSIGRTDGSAKARGEAVYGADFLPHGTIHGVILRSPTPRGRITKLDVGPARKMPGVRAVVSAEDVPDALAGWVMREQPLFARDVVRFEGEPVAAVAADTLEQARAAAEAIVLEIDEMDAVVDLEWSISEDAPLIHPDWQSYQPAAGGDYPRRANIAAETLSDPDGVDEAFANAAHVIEDEFRAPRNYQGYIEPKGTVAIYRDGRYEVHTSHQFPFNVRDRIAQYLDIRPTAVRVVGHTIGGGFGAKLDASIEPHACVLSKAAGGLPVRIVNSRADDMLTCPSRENAITRIRTAVDADGNMIAREFEVLADNGAYSGEMPWLCAIALHCARGVYRVGPTRVTARLVYTNTTPTGAYRGVNGAYLYHAIERHTDNIASTIGRDRREYRLEHLFADGEELLNGQVLNDASILRKGFDTIESVAPWSELTSDREPLTGVGIGAAYWVTNPGPGSATIKLNEDGTVNVITAANDNGSGAVALGITQIVAEKFGISPEDVYVSMPDTDMGAFDGGSQGSRTTRVVGKAASIAADEVLEKVKDVASGLLEAASEDIVISGGMVSVAGSPDAGLALATVAASATGTVGPIQGTGSALIEFPEFNPGCASGLLFPSFPSPTYHVHLAEVEVDPVTGEVSVTRYVVAQEVGKVISPSGTYGQVAGGVTQGIGYTLYESLRIGEDGRYQERSLESYRLPLAVDIPRVEFHALEHADPDGPFGAKGVAEPPILLPAAVIANAVSDAVGVAFDNIPITPEAVLDALASKRQTKTA